MPILVDIALKRTYVIESRELLGEHFGSFHKSDSRLIQHDFQPSLSNRLDQVFFSQIDEARIDDPSLSVDVHTIRVDNFQLGIRAGGFFISGDCCLVLTTNNNLNTTVLVDLKHGSIDAKHRLSADGATDFEQFKFIRDSTSRQMIYLIAKKFLDLFKVYFILKIFKTKQKMYILDQAEIRMTYSKWTPTIAECVIT